MPGENLAIQGVTWGPVVSLIISILKKLGIGSERTYKLLTLVLGGGGILLKGWLVDGDLLGALLAAVIAVLGAPGFYELVSKPAYRTLVGKS